MTDNQKSQIDIMRRSGYGYVKIAKMISVSLNTVKSYCRRKNNIEEKEKLPICEECGKPLDKSKRRNRRFCSNNCRMKWWNKHSKSNMPYISNCACCGNEILMRRKNERKYCSHRCYIVARYQDGGSNG